MVHDGFLCAILKQRYPVRLACIWLVKLCCGVRFLRNISVGFTRLFVLFCFAVFR